MTILCEFIGFEVNWKLIIIGFPVHIEATCMYTYMYVIYEYKMYCRLENIYENVEGMFFYV